MTILVFAALVTSACVQGGQDTPSGEANGGGQKGTSERSNPVRQEPTIQQDERQSLTGVISDKEKGSCPYSKRPCIRILVEEDPDADCRGGRGPLESGCEKMYFDVTGETEVLRKKGDNRKAASSAADLHHRKGPPSADLTERPTGIRPRVFVARGDGTLEEGIARWRRSTAARLRLDGAGSC